MWYTWVYYTTIYAYTQYAKRIINKKIRPLLVFVDLRCQTSAKVTLKGTGSFAGTKTLSFKIKEKKGDYNSF